MICDVARCKHPSIVGYAAFLNSAKEVSICEKHWEQHCDESSSFDIRTHFFPTKTKPKPVKNYFTKVRSK
jgi:hypothetical protein